MDIFIKKILLFWALMVSSSVLALKPEPTPLTRALIAEAVYSDNIFVGFKTSYLKHMADMTKIYDVFSNDILNHMPQMPFQRTTLYLLYPSSIRIDSGLELRAYTLQ